jgi:hypothetical protein
MNEDWLTDDYDNTGEGVLDLPEVFTVVHDGVTRKIRGKRNATAHKLAQIFHLHPQTITLTSEDGFAEVPNTSGDFDDIYEGTYTVEGDSRDPSRSKPGCSSSSLVATQQLAYQPPDKKRKVAKGSKSWTPVFSTTQSLVNKPPGVSRQEKQQSGSSLPGAEEKEFVRKIEICKLEGSILKKIHNIPMTLTENTATVPYISDAIAMDAFKGESTVLLDADRLKILDTTGTRGSKFWKGNRRISAIPLSEYRKFLYLKKLPTYGSDDEFETVTIRDKGKRRYVEPGPIQRSDKDVQPSLMVKLGVLEFRIEKLEKNQSNSAELSSKLTEQEVAVSDLRREKDELTSQLSTIQMELQRKADTILTMKQK